MPLDRALIATLIAFTLLAVGIALALFGITVPAGKDPMIPVDANGGAADPTVDRVAKAPTAAITSAFRGTSQRPA